MSLDSEVVNDIAIELGAAAAFIEKDFYAVKVIQAIASYSHSEITPIFCGGTSLSKGYKILKRFSEDVDFRAQYKNGVKPSQGTIKNFRHGIYSAIESIDGITLKIEEKDTGGNYFKVSMSYPQMADITPALRPYLQLDFSYTQAKCEPEERSISSFHSEYLKAEAEAKILCLAPIETAADKFCALIWRVNKRDRDSEQDDPAMIRHLHDLHALNGYTCTREEEFREMVLKSFSDDESKISRAVGIPINDAIENMISILTKDELYRAEYERFVNGMSYADEKEKATFDETVESLNELASKL